MENPQLSDKVREISGYNILMLLSVIFGKFSPAKGNIILKYVMKSCKTSMDLKTLNKNILAVEKETISTYLKEEVDSFFENSSEEERLDFIRQVFELMWCDEEISTTAAGVFASICVRWEIDAEPLITSLNIA